MQLCRLTNAQPYFAANVRSLNVRAYLEWLDTVNAPAGLTTLSDMRAASGQRDPFNVSYWGIGNESWAAVATCCRKEYAENSAASPHGADLWSQNQFHCYRAKRR